MKDPQHPVKPAFDQAHDDKEAWRQQQIAALTDHQREQYHQLFEHQQRELEAKATQLDAHRKDDIADAMRKHLSPSGQPRHLMTGPHNAPHLHNLNRARESVDDHLKGKDTPETQRHAALLNNAQAKSEKTVDLDHKQTLQNHQHKQQTDRDRFLRNAAKDRHRAELHDQFQKAAKDPTQRGPSDHFNQAAQDKAWQQALEKAADQEAVRGLEQERERTDDADHKR